LLQFDNTWLDDGRLFARWRPHSRELLISSHDKDPRWAGHSWTKRSASTAITPREYGSLSVLETDRKRLEGLIEQGYNDAVHHDCKTNRCVLPTDP
jgi:hypothetical protein